MVRLHPLSAFTASCLAVLLVYYSPSIFCNQTFYAADHQLYFEPLSRFIGNAISQLRLPLWNPYIHCGMPQVAVPSPGIFYPLNSLFAVLPYGQASAWLMVLHQLIAGLGAFLLVTSLGWGVMAACTGGIVAAFSGYMFSLSGNYTLVATAAWIPMSLWLMRSIRTCDQFNRRCFLASLASFSIFMIIAAGRPETALPAIGLIVAFALLQSKSNSNEQRSYRDNLFWQALPLACAALLAMAVILPVFEWARISPRGKGLEMRFVMTWSANWYDLLCMVFAQPLGDLNIIDGKYLNLVASRAGFVPFIPSTLVGPIALSLAIWGICDHTWKMRLWLVLIFVLSLTMTLGANSYIVPKLVAFIPHADALRYPIKLIIFPILCIGVAAARGMYCLASGQKQPKALAATIALWCVSLLVGATYLVAGLSGKPLPILALAKRADAQILLGQSIMLGSFLGLASCALAYLTTQKKLASEITTTALIFMLALSLLIPAFYYHTDTIAVDYFQARPYLLQKLDELAAGEKARAGDRLLLLYFDPLKAPKGDYPGPANSTSLNCYRYTRNLLLPNTNIDWLQPETFGYEAAEIESFYSLFLNCFHRCSPGLTQYPNPGSVSDDLPLYAFCRATATKWICTQIENNFGPAAMLPDKYFQLMLEDPPMNLRIYQVKSWLPRAFVCYTWHWVHSSERVLAEMGDPRSSKFDPQKDALIENTADPNQVWVGPIAREPYPKRPPAPDTEDDQAVWTQHGYLHPIVAIDPGQAKRQPATIIKDSPEHISISVNLKQDTFLILCDQYYPGWKAHLDSIIVPIYRANGVFRGVYVPKGAHLIQFDFEPESVTWGLGLAGLGALMNLALLWIAAWPNVWRWLKVMSGQE
jgi:hypothetical protein